MTRWTLSLGAVGLMISGCNLLQPPPNEAAFLEGTWSVTPENPGDFELVEYEAVFDANGQLASLTATKEDGATATLDTTGATTTVDGDQVTISVPRAGGTSVLEGTLSEDQNTITGSLSREIDLEDLDVLLPGGTITLERAAS